MAKEMLDILANKEKLRKILSSKTAEEMVDRLKEEVVDLTLQDTQDLSRVLNIVAEEGNISEDKLDEICGGERIREAFKKLDEDQIKNICDVIYNPEF